MEEEPVIVKETTWNNSYEESKALAEEAVSTWFTGLTGVYNNVTNEHVKSRGKRCAVCLCELPNGLLRKKRNTWNDIWSSI